MVSVLTGCGRDSQLEEGLLGDFESYPNTDDLRVKDETVAFGFPKPAAVFSKSHLKQDIWGTSSWRNRLHPWCLSLSAYHSHVGKLI